jgi:hypothetical protein
MSRPSHKELTGKLQTALQMVHANRILLVEPGVIVSDAINLGYSVRDELQAVLIDILNVTCPDHYAGGRPPGKSYEACIRNLELWAFSVDCPRLDSRVYCKFALHSDYFYLVSLHVCRSQEE